MATTDAKIRVVVADDHPIYREGTVRGLTLSGRVDVVGEADDGPSALAAIKQHDPDVAIIDYRMPGMDGLGIVHAATRDSLRTRILLLSAITESSVVFQAIEEGAAGYLPKDASRADVVEAVAKIARGYTVIPDELTGALAGEIRMRADRAGPILSEREGQVLKAFARGLSIPQVAQELFIGVSTVKTHTARLYEKLGVSDRAAAVAEGMRRGLVE
ncbi:response regulator [Streptomyces sp. NRRL F-2664]|uniref:response regulator n=1 Tax=Streptomyces sp. NRRL F-2664 TaxID=1463842 RepID=UPI0009961F1B|nr:response regulator transcription factor [Streptomyces sp. NRRL F-2664]